MTIPKYQINTQIPPKTNEKIDVYLISGVELGFVTALDSSDRIKSIAEEIYLGFISSELIT